MDNDISMLKAPPKTSPMPGLNLNYAGIADPLCYILRLDKNRSMSCKYKEKCIRRNNCICEYILPNGTTVCKVSKYNIDSAIKL